jgi:hypothetical protein
MNYDDRSKKELGKNEKNPANENSQVEVPKKRRLKVVQVGNFKVQIDPKTSIMSTPRGDLVRRFKRIQSGMGTSRLPLASIDEDRPRRPIDPSVDTSRFVSRAKLNRALESRLGLRHGSVSSTPPKPFYDRSSDIDDDDDSES